MGLDNPIFEGGGDAFSRWNIGNTWLPKPCYHTQVVKVQSQCTRVTFFRESLCINCRSDSLGLNLAYEGLLLGIRGEGCKKLPDKASPRARTFDSFTITHISSLVLQERTSFTKEPWYRLSPSGIRPGGGPRGIRRSHWRPLMLRGPVGEAVKEGDTC
jgi:hypothetical protein